MENILDFNQFRTYARRERVNPRCRVTPFIERLMNLELFWIWIADKIRHCTRQHAVYDWRAGVFFCACNTLDVCSNVDSVTNYPVCNTAKTLKWLFHRSKHVVSIEVNAD
jgi:hypothetical protein